MEWKDIEKQKKLEHLHQQLDCFPTFVDKDAYYQNRQCFWKELAIQFPWGCSQLGQKLYYKEPKTIFRYLVYSSFENVCLSIKYGILSSMRNSMISLKQLHTKGYNLYLVLVCKFCVFGIAKVNDIDLTKSFLYWVPVEKYHDLASDKIELVGVIKVQFLAVGQYESCKYRKEGQKTFNKEKDLTMEQIEEIYGGLILSPFVEAIKFISADQAQQNNRMQEISMLQQNRMQEIELIYQRKSEQWLKIIEKRQKGNRCGPNSGASRVFYKQK